MVYQKENKELIMVNEVLRATDEAEVNTVDTSPASVSVRNALNSLRYTLLSNEELGWNWNTITVPTGVDANGEIRVGDNILSLKSSLPNIMVRNGLIYDIKNDTTKNVFVGYGPLEAVIDLDYEDLPIAARDLLVQQCILKEQIRQSVSQAERAETRDAIIRALDSLGGTEIRRDLRDPKNRVFGNSSVYGLDTQLLSGTLL